MKRRRLAALAIYAAVVGLLFEGAARFALSNQAFRQRLFTNDDASWRLQWIARQHSEGTLSYGIDEWNESRGWTLKAGLHDVEFRGKAVNSNSKGVRGRQEYSYDKPAGITRILVLGDSFTFGEEVADDETFAHQLQLRLPGSEVLNLGIHGYGHDQMLLYLREEGIKYHPDLVLLGFLPDDMERNVLSFRDYAKPHFKATEGGVSLTTGPIPTPKATLEREPWRSKFGDLLTMLRSGYEWRSGRTQRITRDLTWALLNEIRATSEAAGAKAAFFYLPVYGEIPRQDSNLTFREKNFFSGCEERRMNCLHLQAFFAAEGKRGAEFKTVGHWGALEHRVAADGLAQLLRERGLIPDPGGTTKESDRERPRPRS